MAQHALEPLQQPDQQPSQQLQSHQQLPESRQHDQQPPQSKQHDQQPPKVYQQVNSSTAYIYTCYYPFYMKLFIMPIKNDVKQYK